VWVTTLDGEHAPVGKSVENYKRSVYYTRQGTVMLPKNREEGTDSDTEVRQEASLAFGALRLFSISLSSLRGFGESHH